MSYYDYSQLDSELKNGYFSHSIDTIDPYKTVEALIFLSREIESLKASISLTCCELSELKTQISTLENENKEYKYLFKVISKDYPELVISKPDFFKKE